MFVFITVSIPPMRLTDHAEIFIPAVTCVHFPMLFTFSIDDYPMTTKTNINQLEMDLADVLCK